jgi:hypothetical protein
MRSDAAWGWTCLAKAVLMPITRLKLFLLLRHENFLLCPRTPNPTPSILWLHGTKDEKLPKTCIVMLPLRNLFELMLNIVLLFFCQDSVVKAVNDTFSISLTGRALRKI